MLKSIFFCFLFLSSVLFLSADMLNHPIYVSVTEMEYNDKENSLEVSCKIYTNDLEEVLRKEANASVDLITNSQSADTKKKVDQYISKHLQIWADGKKAQWHFIGYEQIDESIQSYFQVDNIKRPSKIEVFDNILYEFSREQLSIIHAIVGGKRKSARLDNPETKVAFEF